MSILKNIQGIKHKLYKISTKTLNRFAAKINRMRINTNYLIFFAALLPVLVLRDFTPSNELRYLSIANEAIANGHLFAFTNHGVPYADKPPLFLWLLMGIKLLFGKYHTLPLLMLSAVPAVVTTWQMSAMMKPYVSKETLRIFEMCLLCSGLFTTASVTLRMDMLMTMFIVLAMRCFFIVYTGGRHSAAARWLWPIFMFLAVFTKGPLGTVLPLVSVSIFLLARKDYKAFRLVADARFFIVSIVLYGIWFTAAWHEGGSSYLDNMLFHQTLGRAFNAFHHKQPFYYYLLMFWPAFFPWCFYLAGCLCQAARHRPCLNIMQCYMLSAATAMFITLSLVSSKLIIYLLPSVPFFIGFGASRIKECQQSRWFTPTTVLPAIILTAALPLLIAANHTSYMTDALKTPLIFTAAATLSAISIWTLATHDRGHALQTVQKTAAAILLTIFIVGCTLPDTNKYFAYGTAARHANIMARRNNAKGYVAVNLKRARNLDVYLGKQVATADPAQVDSGLWKGYILMTTTNDTAIFKKQKFHLTGCVAISYLK